MDPFLVEQLEAATKVAHPNVAHVLQFFRFGHLPDHLQAVSKGFARVAVDLAGQPSGPELTVALRKLLEAKDAAVRNAVSAVARS